ncbi:hypothetical protein YC2023_099955 [Brassica napus]
MIKWRCCPELVQFYGFISVEVLLDTPPGSPKNCPEAKGGSVRVKISLSRPVSFFMVKPRFFPSQVQSTPFKSSLGFWTSPLRSTSYFSPRTLDPKDCGLSRGDPKDCGPRSVLTLSPKSGLGTGLGLCVFWFPLLEVRLWQEAKSNLVTACLALAYIAC